MSLKNFRWNKVFPSLSMNKKDLTKNMTSKMKKSFIETVIELVIVLLIIAGIWIYRWVNSNNINSAEDLAADPSVASMLSDWGVTLPEGTSSAVTENSSSAAETSESALVSAETIADSDGNPTEVSPVYVSDNVYNDALAVDVSSLGEYDYAVELNGGDPYFLTEEGFVIPDPTYPENCIFEYYSPLDELGRCGPALACLSSATMPAPDEERGDISSIYPSGWNQQQAPDINGGYLYNRSHLIAWCLAGENANALNLITGTRQFNVDGMYDAAEGAVLSYLQDYPEAHVMYRVTPVFVGDELVARGVVIEAWSIEDNGALSLCYFVPNIQSGWEINYATGEAEPLG